MASLSSFRQTHSLPPLPRIAPITGVIFVAVLALAGLLATAGVAARPELQAAGLPHLMLALAAGVGTSASAAVAVAAYAGPWLVARRLRTTGGATALATLGWGRTDLLRACVPLAGLCVVGAVLAASWVEPAAWRAVHTVKGSPVASAAVWSRLGAGEVAVLPGGGAAVLGEDRLRMTAGDRAWEASFSNPRPDATAWTFDTATATTTTQGRWSADRLTLRLVDGRAQAWVASPTSPWAAGPTALLARGDDRGRRVLHRRLASVLLVLPLIVLGLCLGWSERRGRFVLAPAVPLLLFVAVRELDGTGLWPWVVGWAPTLLAAGLAAGLWRLR